MSEDPAGPSAEEPGRRNPVVIKVTVTEPAIAAPPAAAVPADPGQAFWNALAAKARLRGGVPNLPIAPKASPGDDGPATRSLDQSEVVTAEQNLRARLPALLQQRIAPYFHTAAGKPGLEFQVERIGYGSLVVWLKVFGLQDLAEPIEQSLPLLTELLAYYVPDAINEFAVTSSGPDLGLSGTAEPVLRGPPPPAKPGLAESAASSVAGGLRLVQAASLSLLTPLLLVLGIGYVVFQAMTARIVATDDLLARHTAAVTKALEDGRKELAAESKAWLDLRATALVAERKALDDERNALRTATLKLIPDGKPAVAPPTILVAAGPCCTTPRVRPACGTPAPARLRNTCGPATEASQPVTASAGR